MKSTVIKIVIALIFLVVFNVLFFLNGLTHSPANWCSYGFATAAYLCLISTPLLAKGSKSAVLIGSLWLRALLFFFVALAVAVVFMLIDPASIKIPLVVESILLGLFIVLQLMSVLANDATTSALQKQ